MTTEPTPSVSEDIIIALTECGFTLLATQAMPYDWIRLKLQHTSRPHPFELDYDGTVRSLVNAVEYCASIVDGLLTQKANTVEGSQIGQMLNDLDTLAHKLTEYVQS